MHVLVVALLLVVGSRQKTNVEIELKPPERSPIPITFVCREKSNQAFLRIGKPLYWDDDPTSTPRQRNNHPFSVGAASSLRPLRSMSKL